jgi:hypothetical protein
MLRAPCALLVRWINRSKCAAGNAIRTRSRRFAQRATSRPLRANIDRMNIEKMLAELREEREGVEQAILVLERIALGRGRRRGRPPKWMTHVKRRGRPPVSKNKPKQELG